MGKKQDCQEGVRTVKLSAPSQGLRLQKVDLQLDQRRRAYLHAASTKFFWARCTAADQSAQPTRQQAYMAYGRSTIGVIDCPTHTLLVL